MHGSEPSTEWETDSDGSESESPGSKPSTPLARVDTLRPLSGASSGRANARAKSWSAPQTQDTECEPQRRPQRSSRVSRPPSSLSTKSTASVHPLLGSHPTTTTSISPSIQITSHHFPPLTHDPHYYHEESSIPIPTPSLYRPRTTSTLSSPSSSALSSLAHIPTRPPSPYAPYASPLLPHHSSYASSSAPPNTSNLRSFFPPSNPLLSLESIHPLLPSPFLGNHLTVLAKRAPMRESLDRVRGAKAAAGGR